MATRAYTNVTQTIVGILPITFGENGLIVEFYRVQGGTVGDTVTIVPSTFTTDIRAVLGSDMNATDNISTSANTSVVFTMVSSSASTSVNYMVSLLCKRAT